MNVPNDANKTKSTDNKRYEHGENNNNSNGAK